MGKRMTRPLPDFLIVGAQKCGTTTLFKDLDGHPDIFFPGRKEPDVLVNFDSLEDMRARYAKLFAGAQPGQFKGEASTSYTMRPTFPHAADNAAKLTGGKCKIIYITRDPVDRIVSHYLHAHAHGAITVPFDDALEQCPELLEYSRYDWQIEPWVRHFGADNVHRTSLEIYSAQRQRQAEMIAAFIGADPALLPTIDSASRANTRLEAKAIRNPIVRSFQQSDFYQLRMKKLFPSEFRATMRRRLLGVPKVHEVNISAKQADFIREALCAEG